MAKTITIQEALLAETALTQEQLQQAQRKQDATGRRLTDVLLELGFIEEGELLAVLGRLYGLRVLPTLQPEDIDHAIATQLPIAFAKAYHMLPLQRVENRLEVAMADPLLTDPLDDLRLLFPGVECHPVLATRRAIIGCINQIFDRAGAERDVTSSFSEEDLQDIASEIIHEPEDLLDASDDGAPVVRLVNSL